MLRKLIAETLGTLILTAGICITVVAAARLQGQANDALLLALSAGFLLAGVYCVFAPVSGGHFNPAVSFGAWIAGNRSAKEAVLYSIVQTVGAALGALTAFLILSQQPGFQPLGFAANGFGNHSPGGFSVLSVFGGEALFSLFFVLVFLRAREGHRATLIGIAFAGCALAAYGLSGAGLNPARSTGAALFAEGWAIGQLWLFWLAPLLGGAGAGLLHKYLSRAASD